MSGLLDSIRARAHEAIAKAPGAVGDRLRRANDALGRPLAPVDELAEREAFTARQQSATPVAAPAPAQAIGEQALVVVYHMEKTRRDAARLTEILDDHAIKYRVINIQEDPSAQMSVRRDSKGHRLPVIFVAGEALGGRAELINAHKSGELKRKLSGI